MNPFLKGLLWGFAGLVVWLNSSVLVAASLPFGWLMYLSFFVMTGAPVWFWVVGPVVGFLRRRGGKGPDNSYEKPPRGPARVHSKT